MYKQMLNQLTVYDFVSPFGGALSPRNRWVRLAQQIDWLALEEAYATHFARGGNRAIPVRCAFGSLVIKKILGMSDAQTVLMIAENPYLQYFIGLPAYRKTPPFSARTMASFRRRICEKEVESAARLMAERPRKKSKSPKSSK